MAFILPLVLVGTTLASLFYPQIQEAVAPKAKTIMPDTRTIATLPEIKSEYTNSNAATDLKGYTPNNSKNVNKKEDIQTQISKIKLPEGSLSVIILALIVFVAVMIAMRSK